MTMGSRGLSTGSAGVLVALLAFGPGCGAGEAPAPEPEPAPGQAPAPRQAPTSGVASLDSGAVGAAVDAFVGMDAIGPPARSPADAAAAFMEYDADGDGLLEEAELPSSLQSVVVRADADGDQAATAEEILALLTAEAQAAAGTMEQFIANMAERAAGESP